MNKKYSFEKIDYLLRPRKQIERKIFIDILSKFQNRCGINLIDYYYIGMGSIFYYDFILFHKYLNMTKMISIDDSVLKKRFEFNKPYEFVKFYNQKSTEFLKEFKKDSNFILWLDYDFGLYDKTTVLFNSVIEDDIALVVQKADIKDFFLITIDIKLPKIRSIKETEEFRKNVLTSLERYISPELIDIKYINNKYYAKVVQSVVINIIEDKIKHRQYLNFYKLFSFEYSDGTPMLTIGGIFDNSNSSQQKMKSEKFIRTDNSIIDIDVPILTYREKLYLDQKIKEHFSDGKILKKDIKEITKNIEFDLGDIENSIRSYLTFYKHYPHYYEGII
ncbi:MAG TPA: O-methyltransferase [Ignavibacteriaceae bacterium]|nr:O-methyltransferase [Ignavibacteriaceae bacterium]